MQIHTSFSRAYLLIGFPDIQQLDVGIVALGSCRIVCSLRSRKTEAGFQIKTLGLEPAANYEDFDSFKGI